MSTNDITGDRLVSKGNNQAYEDGYARIFGSKKAKEWYESIPEQGVICWVWDDDDDGEYRQPALVKRYLPDDKRYQFVTPNDCFDHAEPIKPEECYKP